ncbi:DNA-binding response regulator in two-component regulatory system with AgrS [Cupriavidus basilensis OR16]|uniref:DNA-binding response regulator in two-component regulatory system with AgrS n=1 Tax=Cupriavidus basilensis OR16 TaxID=1127483 RepID=H1S1W0_9BURK|nr:heavy metal response regulator transcription factor [Cupriavidus basilensis]EHP43454.1 DNA-binding response regulator in two-component regulatory system with AgrS [Cupriavidus basilensis OR16]
MRILVVEGEPKTAAYLRKGLTESSFVVDLAVTGADGLHQAVEVSYDLIIMDVMLPGMNGWEVLKQLRQHKNTPVLFLSACDEVEDRVRGLELGADDYLAKPFAFVELLARVRTLLRRGPVREADRIEFEDLEIDLVRHRVTRAGRSIKLTPREFSLLHFLVRRQREVLSRTQIASHVWEMNFDSDSNVVDVAVSRLRAKMDDDFQPKLIHAVRGVGYVLERRQS